MIVDISGGNPNFSCEVSSPCDYNNSLVDSRMGDPVPTVVLLPCLILSVRLEHKLTFHFMDDSF